MVRLKVPAAEIVTVTSLFQFHYGTIKSTIAPVTTSPILSFQFHYGTIKSGEGIFSPCSSNGISIPLWYD